MYSEVELERLLAVILPDSRFAGKVFAVGGFVRDELAGKTSHDLDIVIEMPYGGQRFAQFLLDLFGDKVIRGPIPLSLKYPVWRLVFSEDVDWGGEKFKVGGAFLDLTDTQSFISDDLTQYGSLADDYRRRDFTVNMIFKDLTTGEIIDPSGYGLQDIEKGILRVLPSVKPEYEFTSEPKKILRAIRFVLKYGWDLDFSVETAIINGAEALKKLNPKTIKAELKKIKADGNLRAAIRLFKDLGLWHYIVELLSLEV